MPSLDFFWIIFLLTHGQGNYSKRQKVKGASRLCKCIPQAGEQGSTSAFLSKGCCPFLGYLNIFNF